MNYMSSFKQQLEVVRAQRLLREKLTWQVEMDERMAYYEMARALPDAVLVAEAERNARLARGRAVRQAGADRKYPKYVEGMSTAAYVREFERLNGLRPTELEGCHG